MSDYLSNLSARSLNLATVLQPRLASRFEPPAQGTTAPVDAARVMRAEEPEAAPSPGESIDVEAQPEAAIDAAARPSFTPRSMRRRHEVTASTPEAQPALNTIRSSSERDLGRRIELPVGEDAHVDTPERNEPPRAPHRQLPDLRTQPSVSPAPPRSDPQPPRPILTMVQPEMRVTLVDDIPPRTRLEAPHPSARGPIARRPMIEPATARSETQPSRLAPPESSDEVVASATLPPPAIIARPIVKRVVTESVPVESAPVEAAKPEPAPTIHVSIGRVEVRATPAATPAVARPRAAPPVMSLDEYLRRRAGEDRR